jgi:hypothetical protein
MAAARKGVTGRVSGAASLVSGEQRHHLERGGVESRNKAGGKVQLQSGASEWSSPVQEPDASDLPREC